MFRDQLEVNLKSKIYSLAELYSFVEIIENNYSEDENPPEWVKHALSFVKELEEFTSEDTLKKDKS